jgi:signal transduction histidine kinase
MVFKMIYSSTNPLIYYLFRCGSPDGRIGDIADHYRLQLKSSIRNQRDQWDVIHTTPLLAKVQQIRAAGKPVEPADFESVNSWFNTLTNHLGKYQQIYLSDLDGRILSSNQRDAIGKYLPYAEIVPLLKQSNDGKIFKVRDIGGDQPEPELISASLIGGELFNYEGSRPLVLMAINPLVNIFADVIDSRPALGKRGNMLLVTSDGMMIGLGQGGFSHHNDVHQRQSGLHEVAIQASRGSEGMTSTTDINTEDVLVAYRYLPVTTEDGWGIVVFQYQEELFKELESIIQVRIGFGIVMGLIGLMLIWWLSRYLFRPMQRLTAVSKQIAEGRLETRTGIDRSDEIGLLASVFDEMVTKIETSHHDLEHQVADRTQELNLTLSSLEYQVEERTNELSQKINQLEMAQNELIEVEKLASLGRMVAGFSHELNTPIGIVVGSVSHLQESMVKLHQLLKLEEVNERDLFELISFIDDASDLAFRNTKRAAQLVQSFKRTSVNHYDTEKRRFLVHEAIEDVMLGINPKLKHTNIRLNIDCADDMEIYAQAGKLEQIIQNLIDNSVLHGFNDAEDEGEIGLRLGYINDDLLIEYWDTGKGMDDDGRKRLFEPFYTTAHDKGGSGLGMFVIYNIIRTELKGTIQCDSALGEGCRFTIQIPLDPVPISI